MAEKNKILIIAPHLEPGGVETSLIGMLHTFRSSRVDVDLMLYYHSGHLMKYIPDWVNVLPEKKQYRVFVRPLVELLRSGCWATAVRRFVAKLRHVYYLRTHRDIDRGMDCSYSQYIGTCVTPGLPKISPEKEYDLAISYLTPHNVCRDKVRARRKVAWIHSDYSTISVNAEMELPVWNSFDNIISISADVTRSFVKTFPTLAPLIIEIENMLPPTFVASRAEEFDARAELSEYMEDSQNTKILLSIGRYTHQKNFDNVPQMCRKMLEMMSDDDKDFRWFLIGYGEDEELIRQRIVEAGVEKYVIMLGKRTNPYPYIKACDIYVQPSRYEGKSVTVREAQMFARPVIISNYPTAASQVVDGVDGVIAPLDNDGFAAALTAFMSDSERQEQLQAYLAAYASSYGNVGEIEKVYNLCAFEDK